MVNLYKDPDGEAIYSNSDTTNPVPSHPSNGQQEYSVDVQTVKSLKTRIAELEATLSQLNEVCLYYCRYFLKFASINVNHFLLIPSISLYLHSHYTHIDQTRR